MSALPAGDEAAFLLGVEVRCDSSAVAGARYDAAELNLAVRFVSGATWYDYPGVSWLQARQFARAQSKGRWLHENFPRPKRR